MKGKKGQIFGLFITIVFLFAGGYIIFLAIKGNIDFSLNMQNPEKLIEVYNDADKFMLFANEAGKLAIMQAYYDIAREGNFAGNCIIQDGYIELCSIADDAEKNFVAKINENLQEHTISYSDPQFKTLSYTISLNNDIVNFSSQKMSLHTQVEKGFFPFGAVYTFNPSFSMNLTEIGLENITNVVKISQDCFLKRKEFDVLECMKQIRNSDAATSQRENKRFFDLTTKKRFFYTEDTKAVYEKITLKFFIKEAE